MASVAVDLSLEQGSTYAFGMCWGSGALNASGHPVLDAGGDPVSVPYDLTGCTARLQMRFKQSTDVLVTVTSEDTNGGITFGDGSLTPHTLTSIVIATGVATATLATPADFRVGDVVLVAGNDVSTNGYQTIDAVLDTTHFTFLTNASNGTHNGGTVANAQPDNITVEIPDESTDALTFKSAVYDLKIYWPPGPGIPGREDFVIHGNVAVRLRVTEDVVAP